jgi:lipoic acid synthetase
MQPTPVDADEPRRVAEAVAELEARSIVITSVTRDDLPDGGAAHWVATIEAIRARQPDVQVEVLIPDFAGNMKAADSVVETRPEIYGHNLETVPRLYPFVRRGANYGTSLEVLRRGAKAGLVAKTALMVGLGETDEELLETIKDAREAGVKVVYIGQYLQPSVLHAPVERFVSPAEFAELRRKALALGFDDVRAAPMLRSSTPDGIAELEALL